MILLGYKVVLQQNILCTLKVSFFITYIETTEERVFANIMVMQLLMIWLAAKQT